MKTEVEASGGTVPAVVKSLETGFDPGEVNGWGEFIDAITRDAARNLMVMTTAERAAARMPTLVLTDRVEHAKRLAAMATVPHVLVHGALPAKERKAAMEAIPDARLTIGTTGLLGEGLDISGWAALVLASPISSPVKLLQAVGRVVRLHAGKTRAFVADFLDNHPLAKASFGKRRATYRKYGITLLTAPRG